MTMPHLMNCDHSGDGWCLDCVKKMHDELESLSDENARYSAALELLPDPRVGSKTGRKDYAILLPGDVALKCWEALHRPISNKELHDGQD